VTNRFTEWYEHHSVEGKKLKKHYIVIHTTRPTPPRVQRVEPIRYRQQKQKQQQQRRRRHEKDAFEMCATAALNNNNEKKYI